MKTELFPQTRWPARNAATTRALAFCVAAMVALLAGLLLTAKPAHAKTFTVNIEEDFSNGDVNPGDGVCDASSTFLIPCTLRAAIDEANAFAGADTINFNISNVAGNELKTIKPSKVLPVITDPVTIDGYTQPGATENTKANGNDAVLKIRLDGINLDLNQVFSVTGVAIGTNASNSTVKGLAITRFRTGVTLGSSGNKIEGNFIGTNTSGTTAQGNSLIGVIIDESAPNNTIGGTTPEKRNVISGNGDRGIYIRSTGNKVLGNYIGTNKDGTGDLGNGSNGVELVASDNIIGGNTAGAANTIAFNGKQVSGDGVAVWGSKNNRILSNSIHSNGHLGIDLNNDGPTSNDPGDPDIGANNLQNFPVLSSATTSGGTTTIQGSLNSTSNKTFTLRFFSSPQADPSGFGEGKKFLGTKSVTTDANGNVSFTFVPSKAVAVGQFVTGTATRDSTGDTSEFSFGKLVT